LAVVRCELTGFADHEGFALTELFVEDDVHHTSAFALLMDALCAHDIRCVIIPSRRHLARLPSLRAAICARLRNEGVDLRVMHSDDRDRLYALDGVLPTGANGAVVTTLLTVGCQETLTVGRRWGVPRGHVDVGIHDGVSVLEGRKIAPVSCPHQAALSVCAALGLSEEYRAFRERETTGVGTAGLRYPARRGSDSRTDGRGLVSPERGRATTLEGKDVR
jgi:hypothetical protein